MKCFISITLLLLMEFTSSIDDPTIDTISIYTACNTLPNGLQYILPYGDFSSTTHPLLPVTCSNGNTILDPSLSFTTYTYYFSSLYMYDIGIAGPDLNDFSTWREWYLPDINDENDNNQNKDIYMYGISDDCESECLTNNLKPDIGQYMTGNFYLCAWITKGDCDMDAKTYECYQCSRNSGRSSSSIYPGVCSHIPKSVDYIVHNDHFQCTGNNDNLKPSIGLNHKFCVCYNPTNYGLYKSVIMDQNIYNEQIIQQDQFDSTDDDQNTDQTDNIIYLSNDDFLYGTYRIISSGIYILTENILLNFNS
eukprot:490717_1